ncbi:hypothetical protein [Yimella sp. cx-51]|uniref:hypothetical protein n=1 Tax=Yimella sp. cx-51 TaxID=2770551 RepID=UPI00165DBDD5|nr:hypothetical protein [Yimella sp. cx-51]MBC9957322.1 hypothetical protein [Yimella sp. cx-51]QTH36814.1 hypothetical protein J5M86_07540 [Yimella sp. cx-51]
MARLSRTFAIALAVSCAGFTISPSADAADPSAPQLLLPIGGGYETTALRTFSLEVAARATGATVDILVVPSSYGDAPEDRETNLRQAGTRAAQLDRECDTAVANSPLSTRFPGGCTATLLTLLDRNDALNPLNSNAFRSPETDGAFILGGDQDVAMQVLANTPAEASMNYAASRGVAFGGTSAGNAVESRSMGAGYTAAGYPENAMERDKALIFWGDDPSTDQRGLIFGSKRTILDQHFHQRGRFGRLLSYTAQSVERYGGAGKLGVGVDYGTGVAITNDQTISRPFGESSSALMDFTTASQPQWVGPNQTLTVRNVLTHLMAPGTGMSYDIVARKASVNGEPRTAAKPSALPALTSKRPLLLGGGQNDSATSGALRAFVGSAIGKGPIVVIAAGYSSGTDSSAALASYSKAIKGAGWKGSVTTKAHSTGSINPSALANASAVLFVGGDQQNMPKVLQDKGFVQAVKVATTKTTVMTDGAMTAVMGKDYFANPDPELFDEDAAIEAFRADYPVLKPGLGIVAGYRLDPYLTEGYRWGRLYTGAKASPSAISTGISEKTALQISGGSGTVVGERSVVTADGRSARWLPGSNGALGGLDVYLSTFGPSARVG